MTRALVLLFSVATATSSLAADLDVRLTRVANDKGQILVAVFDSEDGWDGRAKARAAQRVDASKGQVDLRFPDLEPGRYGVLVMHDENGNGTLDKTVLGIPKEGYGFSNNPRLMRRARFDEAVFELPEGGHRIEVEMR